MNLQNRNRLTDIENKLMVNKGDSSGEGEKVYQEFGINIHTTIHKIGKQGPTVQPGNCTQYLVITYNRKESEDNIYV